MAAVRQQCVKFRQIERSVKSFHPIGYELSNLTGSSNLTGECTLIIYTCVSHTSQIKQSIYTYILLIKIIRLPDIKPIYQWSKCFRQQKENLSVLTNEPGRKCCYCIMYIYCIYREVVGAHTHPSLVNQYFKPQKPEHISILVQFYRFLCWPCTVNKKKAGLAICITILYMNVSYTVTNKILQTSFFTLVSLDFLSYIVFRF